jgi:plastocyanin
MKKTATHFRSIVFTLSMLAGGLGTGMVHGQTSHAVDVRNNTFTPQELTITVGDTVVWTNTQGVHNVNGNKSVFPTNPASFGNSLGSGWTYSYVFTLPGVYNYHCDPHATMGMTGKITVQPDPDNLSLTVAFTGMTPHAGQTFWLALLDAATGEELVRTRTEARVTFDVKIQGLKQGESYTVDFYADHNGNGRYDAPPADHAWRLEAPDLAGDTQLNFTHNTNFTDIEWANKLTVSFLGMNPHLGQNFHLYLKDAASGEPLDTISVAPITGAAFQIHSYKIVPGNSYFVDFYADHNKNGVYDAPPADHAWRMGLSGVAGDTTLTFTHNTAFTDISQGSSAVITEQMLQDVRLYPNPATSLLHVALTDNSTDGYAVSILNMTGAVMMTRQYPAGTDHLAIDVSDFSRGLYLLTVRSGSETRSFRFIAQ